MVRSGKKTVNNTKNMHIFGIFRKKRHYFLYQIQTVTVATKQNINVADSNKKKEKKQSRPGKIMRMESATLQKNTKNCFNPRPQVGQIKREEKP